jgi:hypothetical protein
MQLARWIIGIGILFPGIAVIAMNWMIVARALLKLRSKVPSWVPLMGGTLSAVGFLVIPNPHLHRLWWLSFLLDWGSAPGFASTAAWYLRKYLKRAP